MPSLPELTRDFETTLDEIRRTASDLGAKTMGGDSHLVGMQLIEGASDVLATGRALALAHRRGISAYRAGLIGDAAIASAGGWDFKTQPPELDELRALIKAWLFFVRAFCDNAYRLLLGHIEERPARKSGSMGSIANAQNPVARKLAAEAPEVLPWFAGVRETRNVMKEGAAFGFTQLDARGLGLTVYLVTARRDSGEMTVKIGRTVTFADVAEDARRVAQLVDLISSALEPR